MQPVGMVTSTEKQPSEQPVLADAALPSSLATLERLEWVEGRDFQLWSIVILMAVVTALGLLALLVPNLGDIEIKTDTRYLPQLFFGFIVLVALFNAYVLEQKRRLRVTRQELLRELLRRQEGERLSFLDPLTQTFNRRYMEEVLARDLSRAERMGLTLTFMLIDVDNFKSVNTRFGHLMGDRVLQEVAAVLRRTFRASDTIIRYGGDEFLAVLENSTNEQAQIALERLQSNVARWNEENVMVEYEMGLSCGTATYAKGSRLEYVLDEADRAMYEIKHRARAGQATGNRG